MQIKTKVRGGPRGCGGGVIIAVRSDALAAIPQSSVSFPS